MFDTPVVLGISCARREPLSTSHDPWGAKRHAKVPNTARRGHFNLRRSATPRRGSNPASIHWGCPESDAPKRSTAHSWIPAAIPQSPTTLPHPSGENSRSPNCPFPPYQCLRPLRQRRRRPSSPQARWSELGSAWTESGGPRGRKAAIEAASRDTPSTYRSLLGRMHFKRCLDLHTHPARMCRSSQDPGRKSRLADVRR